MAFIFSHKKSFTRWAISIFTDYESVLTKFMREEGWDFATFKEKLAECSTTLLQHCAVGKGKTTEDQRLYMTRVLLDTARDFWLYYPLKEFLESTLVADGNDDDADDNDHVPNSESLHRVKQMLAGFYLTYSMYKTQSYVRNKVRISMDSRDLVAYYYFKRRIAECNKITGFIHRQIIYLILDLSLDDAFSLCSESSECGLSLRTRLRQGVISSRIFNFNEEVKANLFSIALPHHSNDVQTKMAEYESRKGNIIRMALGSSSVAKIIGDQPNVDMDMGVESAATTSNSVDNTESSLVPVSESESGMGKTIIKRQLDAMRETGLEDIVNATISCNSAVDKPIFTIPNILGNSSIDRTIIYEASKRRDLQNHRQLEENGPVDGAKSRARTTGGRKARGRRGRQFATTDQEEDDFDSDVSDEEIDRDCPFIRTVRSIPLNSQNLMNYIRGIPFGATGAGSGSGAN